MQYHYETLVFEIYSGESLKHCAILTSDNDPVLLGLIENALTNGDAGRVGCVRDGDIPWLAKSNKLLLNPLSLEAELLSCEM